MPFLLLAVLLSAIFLPAPTRAEILQATNGILTIIIAGPADPSPGLFTVRTGIDHPDPERDVLYACDPGPCPDPTFTSYISLLDATSSEIWVNDDQRGLGGWPGFTRRSMSGESVSFTTLGTNGFRTGYILPALAVTQDVIIQGETLQSTFVRHTVTLTNISGETRQLGLRYLWDWRIGNKDDAYFRPRDPDGTFQQEFQTFYLPEFVRYEAADSPISPLVKVFGTVGGGSLISPPTAPEELRFAPWDSAQEFPWLFDMPANPENYDDSAIVYYWGSTTLFELEPGNSITFNQYVTTNIESLRRPIPALWKTVSPTGRVCTSDVLNYRLFWRNGGDGTSLNLTITDTRATWVEFVPGSLEFFAQPDSLGTPALVSRAWAPTYDGPWYDGDPPAGQAPPLNFRWVVDRVSPGNSGYIEFDAKVLPDVPWNIGIENEASATNMLDETVFWSERVTNIYGGIEMIKYPSQSEALPGDKVAYTIVYYNDYCLTAVQDAKIWDTLPPGVQFISASAGGYLDEGLLNWDLGTIDAHTVGSVQVYVEITSTTFNIIPNCATMSYNSWDGDPMPFVETCSVNITVNQPQIIFRKFVGIVGEATMVERDGELSYAIDVINQHNMTVSNFVIWDTPPPDVNFIEGMCTGDCTWDGDKVVWEMPDLKPKDDVQVYFTVQVSSTACNVCCENYASMMYSLDGGLSTSIMETKPISASLYNPRVQAMMNVSQDPAIPGEIFQYTTVIANSGKATACNVSASQPLPFEFDYAGCDGPAGSTCYEQDGMVYWFDLPTVAPEAYYTVTMEGEAITTQMALPISILTVQYNNCYDCAPWDAESNPIGARVAQPLLELIGQEADREAALGELMDFALTLTNAGTDTAFNIIVYDTLPAGLEYSMCTVPEGGTCYFDGTLVVWSLTSPAGMVPESEVVLSFSAVITQVLGERYVCADYMNRLGMELYPACGMQGKVKVADAVLSLSKYPDRNPVGENSIFRYWLSLSNTGGVAAKGITLWDTLPPGAEFVGCSGTCMYDGEKVVWEQFPDIGPEGSELVYITVLATPSLGCSNYAQADYFNSAYVPRPRITSDPVCVGVVQPVISVYADVDKRVVRAGQTLDYTLSVANTGTGRAQKAKLWDTLPAGSLLISCTPACSVNAPGTIIFWSLGSIDPGTSEALAFTVSPPGTDCAGVTLFSEARLAYENIGAVTQPEVWATAPPVLAVGGEISLTLTPSKWAVDQGEILEFEIGYSNPCSDTAIGVVVWDTVPADTEFGECIPPCSRKDRVLSWLIPEIGPGAFGFLKFTVTVTGKGPLIGPMVALADYKDVREIPQPRAVSNPVIVSIASPQLVVEKTGPARAVTQEGVTFILLVRNSGTATAYNVVLVDTMPAPLRPPLPGGGFSVLGSVVTWHVGDMGPGREASLELRGEGPELEIEQAVSNRVHSRFCLFPCPDPLLDGPWAVHQVILVPRLLFAVYPNPFNPKTAVRGTLKFTGLPPGSRVGIYTLTGVLIREYQVAHVGRVEWDGRNEQGAEVAAGVYLWAVEFPEGFPGERWRKGKIGLVR